ncbi:uncharacterized protein LOC135484332 [Lineus longissimus]|uniref:uncharacterized protein LOC135484332 n=1 Tax=Lineus longissimus TaxID=88925 RepID=UPI00315D4D03
MHKALSTSRLSLSGPILNKKVTVTLLSGEELQLVTDSKAKVQHLFDQVCQHLSLRETQYFGLAVRNDGEFWFLDLVNKISKYAPKAWKGKRGDGCDGVGRPLLKLYLRVQYFIYFRLLREKVTRHLYYLQLVENVLTYNQSTTLEKCFQLAAYALQANLGSYTPGKHTGHYFQAKKYLPAWVIAERGEKYIILNLSLMHKDLRGVSKVQAELNFIKEASAPPMSHNMLLYRLKKKKSERKPSLWISICPTGLEIYEDVPSSFKNELSVFEWGAIGRLQYNKKKFEIQMENPPHGRKFTYYTTSHDYSGHLLWLCQKTHALQMALQATVSESKRQEEEERRHYRESYIYSDEMDLALEQQNDKTSDRDKRISLISKTSSVTTSGIASEKMQASLDSDNGDDGLSIKNPPSETAVGFSESSGTSSLSRQLGSVSLEKKSYALSESAFRELLSNRTEGGGLDELQPSGKQESREPSSDDTVTTAPVLAPSAIPKLQPVPPVQTVHKEAHSAPASMDILSASSMRFDDDFGVPNSTVRHATAKSVGGVQEAPSVLTGNYNDVVDMFDMIGEGMNVPVSEQEIASCDKVVEPKSVSCEVIWTNSRSAAVHSTSLSHASSGSQATSVKSLGHQPSFESSTIPRKLSHQHSLPQPARSYDSLLQTTVNVPRFESNSCLFHGSQGFVDYNNPTHNDNMGYFNDSSNNLYSYVPVCMENGMNNVDEHSVTQFNVPQVAQAGASIVGTPFSIQSDSIHSSLAVSQTIGAKPPSHPHESNERTIPQLVGQPFTIQSEPVHSALAVSQSTGHRMQAGPGQPMQGQVIVGQPMQAQVVAGQTMKAVSGQPMQAVHGQSPQMQGQPMQMVHSQPMQTLQRQQMQPLQVQQKQVQTLQGQHMQTFQADPMALQGEQMTFQGQQMPTFQGQQMNLQGPQMQTYQGRPMQIFQDQQIQNYQGQQVQTLQGQQVQMISGLPGQNLPSVHGQQYIVNSENHHMPQDINVQYHYNAQNFDGVGVTHDQFNGPYAFQQDSVHAPQPVMRQPPQPVIRPRPDYLRHYVNEEMFKDISAQKKKRLSAGDLISGVLPNIQTNNFSKSTEELSIKSKKPSVTKAYSFGDEKLHPDLENLRSVSSDTSSLPLMTALCNDRTLFDIRTDTVREHPKEMKELQQEEEVVLRQKVDPKNQVPEQRHSSLCSVDTDYSQDTMLSMSSSIQQTSSDDVSLSSVISGPFAVKDGNRVSLCSDKSDLLQHVGVQSQNGQLITIS